MIPRDRRRKTIRLPTPILDDRQFRKEACLFLILSYGNSLRRDDGAGLALGSILERIWLERDVPAQNLALHQLTPDVAESIAADSVSAVLFVDTRIASSPRRRISTSGCAASRPPTFLRPWATT